MAKQRAHKAAAAATRAEKNRQFKAHQQELGLLLDKDGEESAPSTPQKAAAQHPVVDLLSKAMGDTRETCHPGGSGPLLLGPDTHAPPSLANIGLQLV
jgi:hypothetical protein